MNGDGVRVLVVGAGIAGLAAARVLAGWGATVAIVERTAGPTAEGAGIYLPGNAVRALTQLGCGARLAEIAVRIERQRFADHRGRVLFEVDVADAWSGVGPCLAMHRAALHRVLLDGVTDGLVRWGQTPQVITLDDAGVTVGFSDGASDRYDLVVGADGLHSTVRRLVFEAAAPRSLGQYARRFVVPSSADEPVWAVLLGHNSSFLTIPIGDGRTYCYCDGPVSDPPPPLRDLLAGYAESVPTLLDALDEVTNGPGSVHAAAVEEVVLDTWSHGAVLLIGDAAHATSPNMAQGAAMALEDATVLAESLTASATIPDAFAAYQRRRRPRADWVLRQTRRRDRTRTLVPALRNVVLKRFGQRIFDANYRPLREPA